MNAHPTERLDAFADGELPPDAAREVRSHLTTCTECTRELALIRAMGGAMSETMSRPPERSVWGRVHRRITRPIGWLLAVAGVLVLAALSAVEWFREGALTTEWLATTAVAVGVALLAVGIGYEQYREWKESPYKDVER